MSDPKKGATPKAGQAKKAANATFDKMKGHFDAKKVDEWQKKWLAMPENRKKYEKITDAPEVVGEEMVAMVNDIVDFAQGQEGGKSHVFSKIKGSLGGLFGKAKGAVAAGAAQAKGAADKAKAQAEKAAKEAKAQADKAKNKAAGAAKGAADKAKKAAKK